MKLLPRWRRSAAALTLAAAIVPLATQATADAAPKRTATTTKYTRAVFLQHALGLPASNPNPVIESVTYDRFQHLLRQPGHFGILIGDPATDDKFAAAARNVEATAAAAGVKKVYWFNPNLSGSVTVGGVKLPGLDIRDQAGITALNAETQARYGDAWRNLIAQSLGNGYTAQRNFPGEQRQTVTITPAAGAVNDAVSPLYDYSAGTPADAKDSFFLVYNTGNTSAGQADKIVSSVNLTDDAGAAAKVTAAINAVGGANFGRVDQFQWWKDEANERHRAANATSTANGPNVPVVTDADSAAANGGWRVNQITYPELIDLLNNSSDADAAILFGGTWCPNTRAVLPFVNRQAQENDVQVFNFDTVLDGGIIAGNPTGGANVFQSRNNHTATPQGGPTWSFPSFLYGELVKNYLGNFQTEYQTTNTISFYPGGDRTGTSTTVRRLQVPYLIGYKGKGTAGAQDGVTRQWILKTGDNAWKEYMSQWYFTNPLPNQIGLGALPSEAPAWRKINAQLAGFDWRTDPAPLKVNTADFTDADQYLVADDKATVTTTADSAAVELNGPAPIAISPAALAGALAALPAKPTSYNDARAQLIAAANAPTPDAALVANLKTVFGAWNILQSRKTAVNNAWGNAATPGSVAGGAAAKRALEIFFGGLPGGVVSTRTVTAPAVTAGSAPTINLAIANEHGRKPAGTVALTVKQGAATVATASAAVANDAVSFTLPALGAGTYEYTLSYAGDDQLAAFTETGTLTVNPVAVDPPAVVQPPVVVPVPTATPTPTPTITKLKATKLAGAVAKAPTSRKAGKLKVTVTTAANAAKATGKVTVTLKKGKTTKKVTGTLKGGTVTVTIPKLARGTWKVTIAWAGDAKYAAASGSAKSIKVSK